MNRKILPAFALALALAFAFAAPFVSAQTLPPPTPPSGTVSAAEGYYSWNYVLNSHSLMMTMETGLSQPGTHSFTITLPAQQLLHSVYATFDYVPWCPGGGYIVSVDTNAPAALGTSNVEHLVGDKFLSPSQQTQHQTGYRAEFTSITGGGIPVTQVTFTYTMSGACSSVSSSWTVAGVTN